MIGCLDLLIQFKLEQIRRVAAHRMRGLVGLAHKKVGFTLRSLCLAHERLGFTLRSLGLAHKRLGFTLRSLSLAHKR